MSHRVEYPLLLVCVLALQTGCGQPVPATAPQAATVAPTGPAAVATTSELRVAAERFVAALLSGDAAGASRWLTPTAAQRVATEPDLLASVGPSELALEIAEARLVDTDQGVVQCLLTPTGEGQTEELLCLLRRGSNGWRVFGLAWDSGLGAEPRVLQFEPADETEATAGQYVEAPATRPAARTAAIDAEPAADRR
ncbi:hypothetical protein [Botrimarina hoheduenensis]|uniref:Uncharacterized protein n=1 Tax=Botrimarina hoheduenensis TaxID=2528000 RepID=A0A5C5WB38_9BACT|nr:hypothetical protein [Botrimarina hoheduenensis]TWT47727.1 hypothetical protein Pla111_13470 [Botrimarina hoheduenensis]